MVAAQCARATGGPSLPRIPQPRITGELPRSKVIEILEATGAKHIFVTDSYYRTTDLNMIKDFLKLDDTDKMDYKKVWRDCDDHAARA